MARAKVGTLNVVVTAGTSGLTRGLRRSETSIERFTRRAQESSRFISGGFRKGINSAVTGLATFSAASAASVVGAGIAIKKGADNIDDLQKSSKRLLGNDGATGALAGLHQAASDAGVATASLDKGVERLLDTISKGNRGDAAAIKALKNIGMDAKELARLKPEERIMAVVEAMGKVSDAGDQLSYARELFGKAGGELINLFDAGRDAIESSLRSMELFGQAISGIDAEKVATANDEIALLGQAWKGVTMQLAVQFAPIVSDISQRLLGLIHDAGGVGQAVDTAFDSGVSSMGRMLDTIESLELKMLRFQSVVVKTASVIADIAELAEFANPATSPLIHFRKRWKGDSTEERINSIAPEKREEFRKRLKESGGFANEDVDIQAGLKGENDDIQKRIAEVEERRRRRGTLGERFKAYEHQAQIKGQQNAAAKLGEVEEKRLKIEESITEELKKQGREKEGQAGQGKFALTAFGGITGSEGAVTKGEEAAKVIGAAISAREPLPSVRAEAGVEYVKSGTSGDTPRYESKRPSDTPGYLDKASPAMLEAMSQDPARKGVGNEAGLDKIAMILEQIANNTKSPTLGLA